jgi:hypothetical protein
VAKSGTWLGISSIIHCIGSRDKVNRLCQGDLGTNSLSHAHARVTALGIGYIILRTCATVEIVASNILSVFACGSGTVTW